MAATTAQDWRGTIDNFRMMTEWSIKNLEWVGSVSDGDAIRSQALEHLQTILDELHAALPRTERDEAPPD